MNMKITDVQLNGRLQRRHLRPSQEYFVSLGITAGVYGINKVKYSSGYAPRHESFMHSAMECLFVNDLEF